MKKNMMVLQFIINHMHICADIQFIDKVILLPLVEPIPGAPFFIAGQINVAGHSLPMLDLTLYLGLERKKSYSLDTPILLCKEQNHRAGIIVDKLLSLDEVSTTHLQMKEKFDKESSFKASLLIKDKLTLLLNISDILQKTASFKTMDIIEHQYD